MFVGNEKIDRRTKNIVIVVIICVFVIWIRSILTWIINLSKNRKIDHKKPVTLLKLQEDR